MVHQKPGYSNADALVHFHVAMVIYLGEGFPGNGYPFIDSSQGGTLDGLLNPLNPWVDPAFKVVPARGKVTNGAAVRAFRDMIARVRNRVQHLVEAGKN